MLNDLHHLTCHVLLLVMDASVTCHVASSAVCWCLICSCFYPL
jgi:hypothetical protein